MVFTVDFMISVVVPTYNRKNLLRLCLDSLMDQSYKSYEVIVVDDGSTDGTESLVKSLQGDSKKLRYFRQNNMGHSLARNMGFSKAEGDIIASTDDDCVVEREWLEKIHERFKRYPDIVAVGGSIINPHNTKISWSHYILGFSSWSPEFKKRFIRDIPTCNIAYKREFISGLKFEDDKKTLGYRDSLFNFEVSKRGKILFDHHIKVYHHRWPGGASITEFLKTQKRQSLGFYHGGYKVHGTVGKTLRIVWFLNVFCPRLLPVLYRCMKSGRTIKFIKNFPLLLRGEIERVRYK